MKCAYKHEKNEQIEELEKKMDELRVGNKEIEMEVNELMVK